MNEHCNICARTRDDHAEMDHPFHTLAELRAAYDARVAKEHRIAVYQRAREDGRAARADLRDAVKGLTAAHFKASGKSLDHDREMEFCVLLDDAKEALDTLEETFNV